MSLDAWQVADGAAWARAHPGRAALVATAATYAGAVLVAAGAAAWFSQAATGQVPALLIVVVVLVGAGAFVVALPAALGFAAACCVTARELTVGVVAGFAAGMLGLVVVAFAAPAQLLG